MTSHVESACDPPDDGSRPCDDPVIEAMRRHREGQAANRQAVDVALLTEEHNVEVDELNRLGQRADNDADEEGGQPESVGGR